SPISDAWQLITDYRSQLRKGAWLPRSFTLSSRLGTWRSFTSLPHPFLIFPSSFLIFNSTFSRFLLFSALHIGNPKNSRARRSTNAPSPRVGLKAAAADSL